MNLGSPAGGGGVSGGAAGSVPTVAEVERIAALADPVLRLDRLWERLVERARPLARQALTELLMTQALPSERLRLGSDLTAAYPASLARLDSPELAALVARLDPDPTSPRGSGTSDWSDLGQRMHYVADYFRAYQERTPCWSRRSPPIRCARSMPAGCHRAVSKACI
jgi:hypothetical protein